MDTMENLIEFADLDPRHDCRRIGGIPQAPARAFLIDTVAIRNHRNVLKIKSGVEF